MSVQKNLLRFARSVVQNVISQVTQQLNLINEQVNQKISGYLKTVVDGMWRGQGATAFVDEMNSIVLPKVGQVLQSFTGINGNINYSVNVIDKADEEVRNMADGLGDLFDQIYKG